MTLNANSNLWRAERTTLDLIALLTDIEDRRMVIVEQSFHEGSWDAVFDEACGMGNLVNELKQELQTTYCEVVSLIKRMNREGL